MNSNTNLWWIMAEKKAQKYGLFLGVFTPSMLTILGTIMYLRFGWVVGNAGMWNALLIVGVANVITFITALSVSSLATSQRVGVGGAYYIISRSLGLEVGGAIGLPLYLSQTVSLTLYCYGLSESISMLFGGGNPVAEVILTIISIILITFGALKATAIVLRLQVIILIAVGISIAALVAGADWSAPVIIPEGNYASKDVAGFWDVFAVFFPAVTGILTGLSLSGDLKDPERDIPWGTLGAVAVGLVLYMIIPVALAHHQNPEALRDDQLIWNSIAWGGAWLVWPGLLTAIISSAIGSILAAPRTLQALADDGVLPEFIGKTTDGEPKFAMYLSGGVALCAVALGDLNAVATVVTLFFLTTYGMINIVNVLEELSGNPSFRPRMRLPWWASLLAALGCFGVMFLINPWASFLAFALELLIYFILSRRALTTTWGDMRAGVMMALTRWTLLSQRQLDHHVRNWRPHILIFSSNVKKDLEPIRLASAFSQGRGITTVCSLRLGDLDDLGDLPEEAERNDAFLSSKGVRAFCEVDVADNFESGVVMVTQANGIAGLQSNTVVFCWPSAETFPLPLIRSMRRLDQLGKSLLVVRIDPDQFKTGENRKDNKTIGIWWSGAEENGDMMLLLAYLLTKSKDWSGYQICLKSILVSSDLEQAAVEQKKREATLHRICEQTRISASVEVVVKQDNESIATIIRRESQSCGLVMMGLGAPDLDEEEAFGEHLQKLAEDLPNLIFVRNSGPFRGALLRAE